MESQLAVDLQGSRIVSYVCKCTQPVDLISLILYYLSGQLISYEKPTILSKFVFFPFKMTEMNIQKGN